MNEFSRKIPFTIKIDENLKKMVTEYCRIEGFIISAFVEKALKRQIQEEAEHLWAMHMIEERMDEEVIEEDIFWKEFKKQRNREKNKK